MLREVAQRNGTPVKQLTPEALVHLESYDYPNNIPQLKAIVGRGANQSMEFGNEIPPDVFWFASQVRQPHEPLARMNHVCTCMHHVRQQHPYKSLYTHI